MYDEGEGTEQDKQKAVYWFTKVAERGCLDAQLSLAIMYDKNEGTEQDKQKAVYWFTKVAEQGHSCAQYDLATMYENGVKQNKSLAKEYFKQSCE